jgi:hypothetical protein
MDIATNFSIFKENSLVDRWHDAPQGTRELRNVIVTKFNHGMDASAHKSGLWAILSVARLAPPRLMNGASHAPPTNRVDSTRKKHKPNAHVS